MIESGARIDSKCELGQNTAVGTGADIGSRSPLCQQARDTNGENA